MDSLIGVQESAFESKNALQHLTAIKTQVDELCAKHSVKILCFVEVGAPRVSLTPYHQRVFEEAVLAGAAKHGHSELSMVVVHTKEMTMTNGPLLRQIGPSLKASLQMLQAFAGRLPPTPKSWLQTRTPARSGGEFQCEPCAPINMEDGRCNCTTYAGRLGWLRCEYMLTRDDLQSSRPFCEMCSDLYEGHNCECECKGCPLWRSY